MTKRRGASRSHSRPRPGRAPRVIILAAGLGARMRSTLPLVLHRIAGRTLIDTILDTAEALSPSQVVLLLGASRGQVEPTIEGRRVAIGETNTRDGSARWLLGALDGKSSDLESVLVLPGDAPNLAAETLARLIARQQDAKLDLALLSFRPPDSAEWNRVVRDRSGRVRRIAPPVESSGRARSAAEAHSGIYCFRGPALERALRQLVERDPRADLTATVEVLARGGKVEALEAEDWREAWSVRTRRELAAAEEIAHRRGIERALDAGATVIDPATTRIDATVTIEPDSVIHPFVILQGRTSLQSGCEIHSFTRVADSRVGSGSVIFPHCDIEGATLGERARVGPFARLRPGTVLEQDVRVGNFVETKEAALRRGVKALHLSYLGDVEIGAGSNIGAGVITCNYDGYVKNRTVVGAGAFIGSDSQLVAPVTVGEGAYVGAGSTITEDVPPGALSLTRAPQKNKEGWVAQRRAARESKTGPGGSGSR